MFCSECGMQNPDESKFCSKCGTPLKGDQAVAEAAVQTAVPAEAAAPAQTAAVAGAAQAQGAQATVSAAPVTAPEPVQEGCISAAWRDIKSTPHWLKRVLTLCLVGCIPILNLGVEGYCLHWARDLSLGKRETMPETIFRKRVIGTGFFAELITLVFAIILVIAVIVVSSLLGGLFALANTQVGLVLAFLVAIVMCIAAFFLYTPFVSAAVMRMTITKRLEFGFNVKEIAGAVKKNFGAVLCAAIVPALIIGAITGIVFLIETLILGASTTGLVSSSYSYVYGYSRSVSTTSVLVFIMTSGFIIVLFGIIAGMLTMFCKLLTYRAIGHWAARTAPEWASEADDSSDFPASNENRNEKPVGDEFPSVQEQFTAQEQVAVTPDTTSQPAGGVSISPEAFSQTIE